MLEVRNLHAKIGDKEILKGINLTVKDGETHAIMGPNGSGKSTLSAVLVGNPMFEVTDGTAVFNGKDLLEMKPEDRANEGIFLSFQYPVEIPGVSMTNFMRTAINEKRKYQGLEPMSAADFIKLMKEKRQIVELDAKLSQRSVNEGPSTSTIVITHYDRLLDIIRPDVIHVLYKGKIVKTAGPELAKEIEARGYDWIKEEVGEK